jgi:flagellar L-ring protein precursor FlgH
MSYRSFTIATGLGMALALISACSSTPPAPLTHTPEFAPVYPPVAERLQNNSGAIFNTRTDNWFGRSKSYQIGDVVTVLLNEETQTERNVAANLNRKSTNNVLSASSGLSSAIQNISIGGSKLSGVMQGIKMDGAEITNSGGGQDSKTAKLIGAVTVTVVEVLANGNLVVRGEKQLALTEGSEIIQLSGIIRPTDISPSNMVQSSRLANAQIAYRGTGDLANATKAGWGTSALMKIWPF